MTFPSFLKHWREYRRFARLPYDQRQVVIYSEGPAYWPHLKEIIFRLTDDRGQPVCYISSHHNDPGLSQSHPLIRPFQIGDGAVRTIFLNTIECNVLVMTMPDLDALYIKRSKNVRHYAYLFHSLVSTSMIYREDAFDAYDSIFLGGPHHYFEIREREKKRSLRPKLLLEHGYSRMDEILKTRGDSEPNISNQPSDDVPLVIIAPSWGPNCLIESGLAESVIESLLRHKYEVALRPHPVTIQKHSKEIDRLRKQYRDTKSFYYDDHTVGDIFIRQSSVMISDWSGAALDYAFGLEKPVLFIDTPPKVNNPNWKVYSRTPIEMACRNKLGTVLPLHDLETTGKAVSALIRDSELIRQSIITTREKSVFNITKSSDAAAEHLLNLTGQFSENRTQGL